VRLTKQAGRQGVGGSGGHVHDDGGGEVDNEHPIPMDCEISQNSGSGSGTSFDYPSFYKIEQLSDPKTKISKSETTPDEFTMEFRIANLDLLQHSVGDLTLHAATCPKAVRTCFYGSTTHSTSVRASSTGIGICITVSMF
jgi:hypothetical protein